MLLFVTNSKRLRRLEIVKYCVTLTVCMIKVHVNVTIFFPYCHMFQVPLGLGVEDIDTDDQGDITLVALYAYDIFQYYKEREVRGITMWACFVDLIGFQMSFYLLFSYSQCCLTASDVRHGTY